MFSLIFAKRNKVANGKEDQAAIHKCNYEQKRKKCPKALLLLNDFRQDSVDHWTNRNAKRNRSNYLIAMDSPMYYAQNSSYFYTSTKSKIPLKCS